MQVRVRNVGCADYNAATTNALLRAYWTLASTGEHWSTDWTTSEVGRSGGGLLPAGGEITPHYYGIYIPDMPPGGQEVFDIPWLPVDPTEYLGSPTNVDVCFLGRIVEPLQPDSGIYGGETTYIS